VPESDKAVKELTTAQRKALPHLLSSRSVEEAAKAAGISARTLYRWMADSAFGAALAESETMAIDYAVRRLIVLSDSAVDTLETVLKDDKASASTKVRAAMGILDSLIKLRELRNFEARIVALEKAYYDASKP
jgi:hypothetical protein